MLYRLQDDGTFAKPDYYKSDEVIESVVLSAGIPLSRIVE